MKISKANIQNIVKVQVLYTTRKSPKVVTSLNYRQNYLLGSLCEFELDLYEYEAQI